MRVQQDAAPQSRVMAAAAAETMRDDHDTRRGYVIGAGGVVETAAPRSKSSNSSSMLPILMSRSGEMSSNITVSEEGEGEAKASE